MLVVFVRALILYLIVVVVMRIMGKRQIGQLQPFELAAAIMISELAAVPMQNTGIPLVNGIIPIITLLAAQLLISFLSLKSIRARALICGKPTILIEKGKIKVKELQKELYTLNDLLEQLRINNYPNVADVEYAVLETNGQLSIIPKSRKRPLTPEDMNIKTDYENIPIDAIIDGRVLSQNLKKAGKDLAWLETELRKKHYDSPGQVLYACIDPSGKLHIQAYEKGAADINEASRYN
ncbi:MAG: YetF domain-containing protein [Bacillota bacterium]